MSISGRPKSEVIERLRLTEAQLVLVECRLTELMDALIGMHPSNRSPDCFCPTYYDTERLGHSSECISALAALRSSSQHRRYLHERSVDT